MIAKNKKNKSDALKSKTLLIIALIAMIMGLLHPIMFAFGAIFLLFAVNAFLMETYKTKLPKTFIRMNKESKKSSKVALSTLTFISILSVIMSTSAIQSDTIGVLVLFLILTMPILSLVSFLVYFITHITKKTESLLMFILRVTAVIIAVLIFNLSKPKINSGLSGIGTLIGAYLYASCALLVVGTYIPEKIFLSSQNDHKKAKSNIVE